MGDQPVGRGRSGSDGPEFDDVLRTRSVHAVFQPLIDLDSGETVGFEALGRGPTGSRWESPAALFGEAYRVGRVPELDWCCRAAAFRAATAANLDPTLSLFINMEPISVGTSCPSDLLSTMDRLPAGTRVVMEVTERAVAADPAGLLAAVGRAREAGWGVALDDVGAEPDSLAMMPFIRPDVIKLDLSLIQNRTTAEIARIVNAVLAQSEQTGATILAEGVETVRHADIARTMGATVGQGWLFARPGPLPALTPATKRPVPVRVPTAGVGLTPYQCVTAHRPTTRSTKELLLPMSMHLEHKGLDSVEPTVLLACFQHVRHFTPATGRRYAMLAERAAFVGAVGEGMPTSPGPRILGGELPPGDPLYGEWSVIAVGPHFAGALVASDCGDGGPQAQRRFDFVITHDRELVVQAAMGLMTRLIPAGSSALSGGGWT